MDSSSDIPIWKTVLSVLIPLYGPVTMSNHSWSYANTSNSLADPPGTPKVKMGETEMIPYQGAIVYKCIIHNGPDTQEA
jgi:hypothetical protein